MSTAPITLASDAIDQAMDAVLRLAAEARPTFREWGDYSLSAFDHPDQASVEVRLPSLDVYADIIVGIEADDLLSLTTHLSDSRGINIDADEDDELHDKSACHLEVEPSALVPLVVAEAKAILMVMHAYVQANPEKRPDEVREEEVPKTL